MVVSLSCSPISLLLDRYLTEMPSPSLSRPVPGADSVMLTATDLNLSSTRRMSAEGGQETFFPQALGTMVTGIKFNFSSTCRMCAGEGGRGEAARPGTEHSLSANICTEALAGGGGMGLETLSPRAHSGIAHRHQLLTSPARGGGCLQGGENLLPTKLLLLQPNWVALRRASTQQSC